MKRFVCAAVMAAMMLSGGAALASPGLAERDALLTVEDYAAGDYPVLTEGPILRRARVNAAVAAEAARFTQWVEDSRAHGEVSGWISWQDGRRDDDLVSLVLLESIYYQGAAHPSTRVVGMTFDSEGALISREEALRRTPVRDAAGIMAFIERQAVERGLDLFPREWRVVKDWPECFYVGEDNHLYFIFQQYEIAPYAAGWIAIDVGPWDESGGGEK